MAGIKNVPEVMHRIRCKLYPNYLPHSGGSYIARTDNEASLGIDEVCAALKSRGGFSGNYETLAEYVKQYYNEAAYQLCDGFAVNNGYYTVYPNVGGTFASLNEAPDPKKHPLGFRFRAGAALRNLARHIAIDIEGLAKVPAYIDQFIDTDEDSVNGVFVPGNLFKIMGHKIKVEGNSSEAGVFFVPVDDPGKAVRVERIGENSPSKILGVAPDTHFQYNRIEIRTLFTGSKPLKAPRVITGTFIIEAV